MAEAPKFHSAIRWGKTIPEIKDAGCATKENADAKDPGNGNSAIHIAVQNGHHDIAQFLISDMKCDVNVQNGSGNTALHMAVEYDYYAICKMLLDAGADGELPNKEGHKSITGLGGSKVGQEAWDNPVTILKGATDEPALKHVFELLEAAPKESLKKDELVRVGMMKKKQVDAWMAGGYQPRFMELVKSIP